MVGSVGMIDLMFLACSCVSNGSTFLATENLRNKAFDHWLVKSIYISSFCSSLIDKMKVVVESTIFHRNSCMNRENFPIICHEVLQNSWTN